MSDRDDSEADDENPERRIPEDEAAAIGLVEVDAGRELTDQERNLVAAQAELIGDI